MADPLKKDEKNYYVHRLKVHGELNKINIINYDIQSLLLNHRHCKIEQIDVCF